MQTNAFPVQDISDNTTGCCPRFKPAGWDNQHLHFEDKKFLRATTRSAMHVPWNMGQVFTRVQTHIEDQMAADPTAEIVLSRDISPWQAEHYFVRRVPLNSGRLQLSCSTVAVTMWWAESAFLRQCSLNPVRDHAVFVGPFRFKSGGLKTLF